MDDPLNRAPFTNSSFSIWTFIWAFLASLVVPLVIFTSTCAIIVTPTLYHLEQQLIEATEHNEREQFRTHWEGQIETILRSKNPVERQSFLMGRHADAQYPIFIPRNVFREPAHILGDSGSGKSALVLAPMIAQSIRFAARDLAEFERATAGERIEKQLMQSSIVVIDLKGDMALFHGVKREAEAAGLPFRWFTNQLDCSTFAFNPMLQGYIKGLTPNQLTETSLQSFGLFHGDGYGRSYFSRAHRKVLAAIIREFYCDLQSLRDIYERTTEASFTTLGTKSGLTRNDIESADELFATLDSLRQFDALNATEPEFAGQQIDMYRVVREPQVVYFYLPAAIESASTREIGKLALYALFTAVDRRGTPETPFQVSCYIDEWQQIVADNLKHILQQGRSKGVGFVLANQAISDLDEAGMTETVQANTRFKQYVASSDPRQRDALMQAAGETAAYIRSWSSEHQWALAAQERADPRITPNDLIRLSDHPNLSVVQVTRGEGYAQFAGFPFVMRSNFHISKRQYDRREKQPWPEAVSGTLAPRTHTAVDGVEPPPGAAVADAPPQDSFEDIVAQRKAASQKRGEDQRRQARKRAATEKKRRNSRKDKS